MDACMCTLVEILVNWASLPIQDNIDHGKKNYMYNVRGGHGQRKIMMVLGC